MNLLKDRWIPVRRKDGQREEIAPYDITSEIQKNPIVAIESPRPDFDAALTQFLIALLQTLFAPKDDGEWDTFMVNPPDAARLQEVFLGVEEYFGLFDPNKPFMQDKTIANQCEVRPIERLFIDAPGENTLQQNRDFFIKRDTIEKISPQVAAMALLTLQINAPSGGKGHRVSVRGGGPLSTLVKIKSVGQEKPLWSNLWLNVLPEDSFPNGGIQTKKLPWEKIFPWIDDNITQYFGAEATAAACSQFHKYAIFWVCPRRILFKQEKAKDGDICDITGKKSDVFVREYQTQSYGMNLKDGWNHPFSPYERSKKDKEGMNAVVTKPYHFLYKNWPVMIGARQDAKAAIVVNKAI
ncbi:MAG: type I-E CRISPR-associated protein Cse1/CasA, partial [Leptospiraceae bacterium]|nr:type I-E CRISPR-associated protein Cse1/CasA [Leptospiraceae bacterium]